MNPVAPLEEDADAEAEDEAAIIIERTRFQPLTSVST